MSSSPQVRLANDIAAQFRHVPFEDGVTAVANHVRSFWDRRMRAELERHADAGGEGLDPIARAAVERLRARPGA